MTSTMTLSAKVFPGGDQVPGTTLNYMGSVPDDSSQQVSANYNSDGYQFIFWDINLQIYTPKYSAPGIPDQVQTVNFNAPTDESFYATAWYVPEGGNGTGVTARAFSLNKDMVVSNSPLASVVPADAQTGPYTVSTATSVVITAAGVISGYGRLYNSWVQYTGNGTVNNRTLSVPAGGASVAIAFYYIPEPDPCQDLRENIANFNPSDYATPADAERVLRGLSLQLEACEREYGETPGLGL